MTTTSNINHELIKMLNYALQLEYAAIIQYRTHAEMLSGPCSEKLIERLKEIAGDEEKHAEKFRTLISSYLDGEPVMTLAETHKAENLDKILSINLKDEKTAVDFYKDIYRKVIENKDKLQYTFETLEHEIRHIILDEQEHITELTTLIGK
jgi:bacterioferritin (cytochrome b1)